jgi:prephenate dehydrogenase
MKRWVLTIRGRESGRTTKLTFMRFWTKRSAQRWIDTHPNEHDDVTEWVITRR